MRVLDWQGVTLYLDITVLDGVVSNVNLVSLIGRVVPNSDTEFIVQALRDAIVGKPVSEWETLDFFLVMKQKECTNGGRR